MPVSIDTFGLLKKAMISFLFLPLMVSLPVVARADGKVPCEIQGPYYTYSSLTDVALGLGLHSTRFFLSTSPIYCDLGDPSCPILRDASGKAQLFDQYVASYQSSIVAWTVTAEHGLVQNTIFTASSASSQSLNYIDPPLPKATGQLFELYENTGTGIWEISLGSPAFAYRGATNSNPSCGLNPSNALCVAAQKDVLAQVQTRLAQLKTLGVCQ